MAKKFTRTIDNVNDITKQPYNTNKPGDILTTSNSDAYVRLQGSSYAEITGQSLAASTASDVASLTRVDSSNASAITSLNSAAVKTVNSLAPDSAGNVNISTGAPASDRVAFGMYIAANGLKCTGTAGGTTPVVTGGDAYFEIFGYYSVTDKYIYITNKILYNQGITIPVAGFNSNAGFTITNNDTASSFSLYYASDNKTLEDVQADLGNIFLAQLSDVDGQTDDTATQAVSTFDFNTVVTANSANDETRLFNGTFSYDQSTDVFTITARSIFDETLPTTPQTITLRHNFV